MFDWVLGMLLRCLKESFSPYTNINMCKEVFSCMPKLIVICKVAALRGVFEESCFGNLIYILKFVVELSCRNKDKITVKYL